MTRIRISGIIALLLVSILSCSKQEQLQITVPSEFDAYISGFTSGEISAFGEIGVTLADQIPENKRLESGLFVIDPAVKGSAKWVNDRTVVFKPASSLQNDVQYTVQFNLDKVMDVAKGKSPFVFRFATIKQDMEVELAGIEPDPANKNTLSIEGTIYTADVADPTRIKKVIKATQIGEALEINWQKDAGTKSFRFQISGIQRLEELSKVKISWNGSPIGADAKGSSEVEVSAIGDFELLETRVFRDENPRIELTFSDPLDAQQNLEGLIRLEKDIPLNYIISENKVVVNPRNRRNGDEVLIIDENIKSASGKELGTSYRRTIRFYQPKPQVVLLGKGVIIPRSENLYVPFKAVSLGAVDVQISRIFENNIGQMLQDYELDGMSSWNLRRVGRPVFSGVIPLSSLGSVDVGDWNNYALDLSEFIEPEPGAIYQVEIGFRAHQAIYPCDANSPVSSTISENQSWTLSPELEAEYWDNYSDYYYPDGYTWRDRDNPCTVSYYNDNRRIKRNVLASDLGIIAKRGADKEVTIFITDIRNATLKAGVTVQLFDFQQQELSSGVSGADGKLVLPADHEPHYIIASIDDQKGYLRVDDASSLSLSDFDVSGARVQKGLKGFLYGERGVWRPGDSLFVTLILEDKNQVLPEGHPVTFELRDPSGQLTDRQTFRASLNGFFVYEGKTEKQAPTGNWRLTAKAGGQSYTKVLKIETVKPNRLKVEVDFEEDFITSRDRKMKATLHSQWLHGATARNLKADAEMSLSPAEPSFDGYDDFSFTDETISFSSTPEQIFDGTLDETGNVDFTHTFAPLAEGPAKVSVNLNLRVFEPSGNFSVGRTSTTYYPFRTIVGVKPPVADDDRYGNWLSRNEEHRFEVVTLNNEGVPVGFKELRYEVYHIRWRWWWERGRENLSSYFQRQNVRKISSGKLTTRSDGTNELKLRVPDGAEGGRYLVRVSDPKGHHSTSTVVYVSWYGGRNSSVSPAQLTFSSDKDSYQTGDDVELTIPSSEGSKILLSLETGSKILETVWLDGKKDETIYTFRADGRMSPNVYAHVMHIQPHAQTDNDLPIRMYGVIPISVEDPETRLAPEITMADELRPETNTTIRVREQNGKAITYTLAMVDEGLLDLTNFNTPQPHPVFYAREALGIKTWDMFEFVTSGFSGNISRILAVGGDGSALSADALNEANRFEPMVRFAGPFYLKEGEANQHTISVPNYVGSVRTMVIAGRNGAYGETEKTTPVRKPVMVLATLPRVLGPAETVDLPVSVFAMKDDIRSIQVEMEASDIFEVIGDHSSTVRFDEAGDELVTFKLKTKTKVGVGKIKVEARSGSETAYHEIEIAVRNPNTPFTDIKEEVMEAGERWTIPFEPQGMAGTNTAILELSRIPPVDFGRRLRYLIRYPHGCIEQTTSSVFAQLYVDKVMEINDERKATIQKNVEEGIRRIARFMTPSGGLGYWPGYEDANSWGTNYAYHFLLEAQKQGYYVPSDLLNKINRFQTNSARNWRETEYTRSDLMQAYRLYTLALAKTPELGAMNRFREREDLSIQARWRLAAAYVMIGQPEAAEDIVQGASTIVPDYRELSGSFGSSLRDRAMILETLSLLDWEEVASIQARDIAKALSSQTWHSTQTTAYGLIAITKFLEKYQAAAIMSADYTLNQSRNGSVNSGAFVVQIPINMDEFNSNELVVDNTGEGTLFARLILEGTPLIGDNVSASNSLRQKVKYMTLNGDEIDPSEITQGSDLVVEVTVSNPGMRGTYKELALTQIFPSGWEIRNTRMESDEFKEPVSNYDYQDIRDDRVYTYFDLRPNSSKTFRMQLNASYLGEFYLPAVSTEAMYDETISARTPGKWVKVTEPGE